MNSYIPNPDVQIIRFLPSSDELPESKHPITLFRPPLPFRERIQKDIIQKSTISSTISPNTTKRKIQTNFMNTDTAQNHTARLYKRTSILLPALSGSPYCQLAAGFHQTYIPDCSERPNTYCSSRETCREMENQFPGTHTGQHEYALKQKKERLVR